MPLSHYAFRALPFEDQLVAVYEEGRWLARRYEEEDWINLYHLGSFFVEVYYDPEANRVHRTRTFTSRECLLDYAAYVSLGNLGL
jgi:hypothetical protein